MTNETTIETDVSVEKALHKALLEFAQTIAKEHGIMIEDVSFEWHEFMGVPPYASSVQLRTKKKG